MLEMLVAMAIALTVLLVVYQFVDWSRRTFVRQSDQAEAHSLGRAAMNLMASEIRTAGYNPMGVRFLALPSGSATAVRVVAVATCLSSVDRASRKPATTATSPS